MNVEAAVCLHSWRPIGFTGFGFRPCSSASSASFSVACRQAVNALRLTAVAVKGCEDELPKT